MKSFTLKCKISFNPIIYQPPPTELLFRPRESSNLGDDRGSVDADMLIQFHYELSEHQNVLTKCFCVIQKMLTLSTSPPYSICVIGVKSKKSHKFFVFSYLLIKYLSTVNSFFHLFLFLQDFLIC